MPLLSDSDVAGNIVHKNDEWCEVDERPTGVTDTLLQDPEATEEVDRIINVAPAPLGLFIDKDSEVLAFPTIFCEKRRRENKDRVVPAKSR